MKMRDERLERLERFKKGSGLKMNRNKLLKIGRGLDKKNRERYATFGKYLIHYSKLGKRSFVDTIPQF